MIDINDITVRIGSKVLLEHTSAHISDGWKVGLVGMNGCGKSTLFRVLQGELETETGSVSFPTRYKVASVSQEQNEIDTPILEFVLSQDAERTELLERLETASVMELGEIHERLNIIEAASASARAASILNGLGFSNADLTRPIKEFSGGWRMRLALAAALFQPSDVLLLDEPTNHLDLEASIWLENHLRKYTGTLLLISHDRYILNDLCNNIIHFEGGKLNTYSGNYDTFEKTRAMQREVQARQAEKQDARRSHLQSYVDRFRYKASKAKQAQSRIKMLEKMEIISGPEAEASSHFEFPNPEPLSSPYLSLEEAAVGYDGRKVLQNLDLRIVENDRIALLGANGNGKSTFAKLISGRLPLMEGSLKGSQKLQVGYFAQHQSEELPLDVTATQYMSTLMPGVLESKVRSHLARFGLNNEKATTIIEKLSGGEKARLLFAAMTRKAPALLILDEPTNHLDIQGRDALTLALNEYKGSVILITHDLHLIELIADDLWLVKDGACKPYLGDLNDYKKLLLEESKAPSKESSENKKNYREQKQKSAEIRAQKAELRKQLRSSEQQLEKNNRRREELSAMFLQELSAEQVVQTQKELAWVDSQIAQDEALWLEITSQLEA